jgi:hypothetical protein
VSLDRPTLPAEVIKAATEPQDLLEEVYAQLGISQAWMSERGVALRCRLAKNQAEVVGALIELERQGRAISQDRDSAMPLWRMAQGSNLPAAPVRETPPPRYRGRGRAIGPQLITTTQPEQHAMGSTTKVARGERATQILDILRAGPLTRDEIATKLGIDSNPVTSALSKLKTAGRVRKAGQRRWELVAGAAVPPARGGARSTRTSAAPPPARPPRRSAAAPAGADLRWYLGSDGSVRFVDQGATIELTAEQFDTLKRAHAVVKASANAQAAE